MLVAGLLDDNAGAVVRALRRAQLGTRVELLGSDALLPVSALFARAGTAARGVHLSFSGLDVDHLGPQGQAFVRAFGSEPAGSRRAGRRSTPPPPPELALDAIAHSGGTRREVLEALARAHPAGILGAIRLDARGDIRPARFTIVRAARPGGSDAVESTEGGTWEREVTP